MKFKYKIGDFVWYRYEWCKVIQRRVQFGYACYRLEDGSIVSEVLL